MIAALPCICGKHMIEQANEGICLWCGHGDARVVTELAYRRNMDVGPEPAPAVAMGSSGRPRTRTWSEERCVDAAREWERTRGALPSMDDWRQPKRPGEHRPSYATIIENFGGWQGFMSAIADVPREALAA